MYPCPLGYLVVWALHKQICQTYHEKYSLELNGGSVSAKRSTTIEWCYFIQQLSCLRGRSKAWRSVKTQGITQNWLTSQWIQHHHQVFPESKDPRPHVLSLPGAWVVCWRPHPAGTWQCSLVLNWGSVCVRQNVHYNWVLFYSTDHLSWLRRRSKTWGYLQTREHSEFVVLFESIYPKRLFILHKDLSTLTWESFWPLLLVQWAF